VSASRRREAARSARSGRLVLGALATVVLAASTASAADPPAPPALATSTKEQVLTLYNQGKELLDAGKTAEACQAFESAKRLDFSAINLILRLGDCYERLGRTASAYSQYQQAASLAAAAKDARRSTAEERVAAVEPRLARVVVVLAPGAAGVTVRRNGEIVAADRLGKPEPIDPGRYTFEATASGKKAWNASRDVAPATTYAVEIPALEPAASAARQVASPSPEAPSSPRRAIGIALGGVGLVGVGVGAVFGVMALSKLAASKANGHCDVDSFCDDTGFQLRRDAQDAGTVSTVTLALGATAAVAGAVLWITAPSSAKAAPPAPKTSSISLLSRVRAGAAGDAHGAGLWLQGAF
jgi:tetratricopeptide (TPR) repeat protein